MVSNSNRVCERVVDAMSIGLLSFNRSHHHWCDRVVAAAMNKSKSRDDIEKRLRKIEKEETKAAKVGNMAGRGIT